jgi:choline dehydrogenase-like flavoprotein
MAELDHYDVVIIGSGADGQALSAPTACRFDTQVTSSRSPAVL